MTLDAEAQTVIIKTAQDIGLIVRSRRHELGWDQQRLAREMGVTRQWVIQLEKGKPRASLELALRALRVLGLDVVVDTRSQTKPGFGFAEKPADLAVDLDQIIAKARSRSP